MATMPGAIGFTAQPRPGRHIFRRTMIILGSVALIAVVVAAVIIVKLSI